MPMNKIGIFILVLYLFILCFVGLANILKYIFVFCVCPSINNSVINAVLHGSVHLNPLIFL